MGRGSSPPPHGMAGSPPPRPPTGGAGRPGPPSSQGKQQHQFGPGGAPRPSGVEANKSPPVSGAGGVAAGGWGQQGPIQGQPQPGNVPGGRAQHFTQGAGGAFGSPPPRSAAGSPAFGGRGAAASEDPARSPAQSDAGNGAPNDAAGTPGAGAAAVAQRLLTRGGGLSTPGKGKGVPHSSSAPVLSGKEHDESEERDSSGNGGGAGTAAAPADGGGRGNEGGVGKGKAVEQAPKSEPRKGAKDKNMPRRASVGGAAVEAKPGFMAKMVSKWLYPEAKVCEAFVCALPHRGVFVRTIGRDGCSLSTSGRPAATWFGMCLLSSFCGHSRQR